VEHRKKPKLTFQDPYAGVADEDLPAGVRANPTYMRQRKAATRMSKEQEKRVLPIELYEAAKEEFCREGQVGNCNKVTNALNRRGFKIDYNTVYRLWKRGSPMRDWPPLEVVLEASMVMAMEQQQRREQDAREEGRAFIVRQFEQRLAMLGNSQYALQLQYRMLLDETAKGGKGLASTANDVLESYLADVTKSLPRMSMEEKRKTLEGLRAFMRDLDEHTRQLITTERSMFGRPDFIVLAQEEVGKKKGLLPQSPEETAHELDVLHDFLIYHGKKRGERTDENMIDAKEG